MENVCCFFSFESPAILHFLHSEMGVLKKNYQQGKNCIVNCFDLYISTCLFISKLYKVKNCVDPKKVLEKYFIR